MMWQDLVFLVGSSLSIVFLAPTLRDSDARVPLATSVPSMTIGLVYSTTFFTLGMTFSATGSLAAGTMWALISLFRSPRMVDGAADAPTMTRTQGIQLFLDDARRWVQSLFGSGIPAGF